MYICCAGNGSPMNAIEGGRARETWRNLGQKLGKPEVILAVSAHWAARGTLVRTAADNRQIYDMYGFPEALYKVRYAPAGSPGFASDVLAQLSGIAKADNTWGIDHGVWSILCNMYPDADVPVVMISTDISAAPQQLFEIGRRLQPLREKGAMILASGNVVHNLRQIDWDLKGGYPWADTFDIRIRDAIVAGDASVPLKPSAIPGCRLAVPSAEHFDPLLVALGATDSTDSVSVWNDYRELGALSMTSYLWQ
ncbi:MAG: class III extradiol ring-cleavage dioxygenase [Lachnospira sp.]|nr:class III extradiol ring-cleavage dioxygenase [Lachnospira sp.]